MIMYLGETREIGIEVIHARNEPFAIQRATYTFAKADGEVIIKDAGATIDEHRILALVTAPAKGSYELVFTYYIGQEVLIARVPVEVR